MTEILNIDILDKEQGGHKDLLFSIPNLIEDKEFDTYYFAKAIEPTVTIDDIKNAVSSLIQFWLDKVSEIKTDDVISCPLTFQTNILAA